MVGGELDPLLFIPLPVSGPVPPPGSRSRRSSPWRTTPGVRAVSLRPSPVPSRPAGRIQPEGPTRGSGVSSWPGPTMSASPGCRLHRSTSPNTSRPWWGSRCCNGAAGGARSVPRVTSGGQKTGCPNRGLHVGTTGEITWSAALDGPDCRIPGRGGNGSAQ